MAPPPPAANSDSTILELLERASHAVRAEQQTESEGSLRRGLLSSIERMLQQPLHAAQMLTQPDLRR